MVSISFRRPGVVLLEKYKCISIHKCNISFVFITNSMDNALNSCMCLWESVSAMLFDSQPGKEQPSCLLYQKLTIGAASHSLKGPETSSQKFPLGKDSSIQLQSCFSIKPVKPSSLKEENCWEITVFLYSVVCIEQIQSCQPFKQDCTHIRWSHTFIFDHGTERPYLGVAVADILHLAEIHTFKAASCRSVSFKHNVFPHIVMMESNFQPQFPPTDSGGRCALEDWTLQYPPAVPKSHSEKVKALWSAVSLACMEHVFLNSQVTIKKWGFLASKPPWRALEVWLLVHIWFS